MRRPQRRFIITVPFGRLEDHGWFVQYDLRRIAALLEATRCDLALAEYYRYNSHGWHGPVDPLTLSDVAYRTGSGAGAVACLELTRRTGSLTEWHPQLFILQELFVVACHFAPDGPESQNFPGRGANAR